MDDDDENDVDKDEDDDQDDGEDEDITTGLTLHLLYMLDKKARNITHEVQKGNSVRYPIHIRQIHF